LTLHTNDTSLILDLGFGADLSMQFLVDLDFLLLEDHQNPCELVSYLYCKALQNWIIFLKALLKQLRKLTIKTNDYGDLNILVLLMLTIND